MNYLDMTILQLFNSVAHHSINFDSAIVYLEKSNLLKGGVIVPMLWLVWFNKQDNDKNKEYMAATIAVSLLAIVIARTVALILPFRPRPIFNTSISFQAPFSLDGSSLEGWSSFPSDHAVFFFTLATGIFLVNRLVGSIAILYSFFAICLPRIYVGHHYPTDIIAGIVLGVCIGCSIRCERVRNILTARLLMWEHRYPQYFYMCLFVLTAQMFYLFDPVRILSRKLLTFIKIFIA